MSKKTHILLSLTAMLVTGSVVTANADTLYGLSSSTPGSLYSVNTATGAATKIFDLSNTSQTSFVGLGYANGKFYATDVLATPSSDWSFGSIDATTGVYTQISTQDGSANWHCLANNLAGNGFYTVDLDNSGVLKTVSTTGVTSTIGATGQDIRGLALDSASGVLYGVDDSNLYTLNTSTGAATLVGSLGASNFRTDLAYDPLNNTMYLNGGDPNDSLYTVDLTTGALTVVGANGVSGSGIDGLTYAVVSRSAVPEPASTTAFGLGVLGILGMIARARKTRSTIG